MTRDEVDLMIRELRRVFDTVRIVGRRMRK